MGGGAKDGKRIGTMLARYKDLGSVHTEVNNCWLREGEGGTEILAPNSRYTVAVVTALASVNELVEFGGYELKEWE